MLFNQALDDPDFVESLGDADLVAYLDSYFNPDPELDPVEFPNLSFTCTFDVSLASFGSSNEYGFKIHNVNPDRRVFGIDTKVLAGPADNSTQVSPLYLNVIDKDYLGVGEGENSEYRVSVTDTQNAKSLFLRVFDRKMNSGDKENDGGFFDAPYYLNLGMQCTVDEIPES